MIRSALIVAMTCLATAASAAEMRMFCTGSTVTTVDATHQNVGGFNDSYWWLIDFDAKRISLCPPPAHNCRDAGTFGWTYSGVGARGAALAHLNPPGQPNEIRLDFAGLTMTMTTHSLFNGKPATGRFLVHCANAW